MGEIRLFTVCTLSLIAAYILHGSWLARRWGVDPGRKRPGALSMPGRKSRMSLAVPAIVCLASCLWLALCLYVYVWERYGTLAGVLAVAGTALLSGVAAFAALFVCVRTDMDLAQTAGEELFPAAKGMMYGLGVLAVLLFWGFMARVILTDAEYDSMITAGCAVIWPVIAVMAASGRIAPEIRNERHMRPAAYGSAVCAGVLAMAARIAAEQDKAVDSPVMIILGMAVMISFYVYPLCLAGDGVRGLIKRRLPRRRKVPDSLWTFLCAAVGVVLGNYGGTWMLHASCAAGAVYMMLAVITCKKWFYRNGRGLFSRN